jgi:hypothetical protein
MPNIQLFWISFQNSCDNFGFHSNKVEPKSKNQVGKIILNLLP